MWLCVRCVMVPKERGDTNFRSVISALNNRLRKPRYQKNGFNDIVSWVTIKCSPCWDYRKVIPVAVSYDKVLLRFLGNTSNVIRLCQIFRFYKDSRKCAKYRRWLAADIFHRSAVIVRQRITVLGLVTWRSVIDTAPKDYSLTKYSTNKEIS